MKLIPESLEESINFERGLDPKAALHIGIVNNITSDDLEMLSYYMDGEESFKDLYGEDDDYQSVLQRMKTIKKILKGSITFGQFFDHKEEDDMVSYIQRYFRGRYVYNAYPGGDGWAIVFSKIYLPRAEEIDV